MKRAETLRALAILCVLTCMAYGQSDETIVVNVAKATHFYADGSTRSEMFEFNNETRKFEPGINPAATKHNFGSVVIERIDRWKKQNYRLLFNFTPDAKPNRGKVNFIFSKYIFKRRGVATSPNPRTQNKTIPVQPLNSFKNIFEYQDQFKQDGHNTIIMTQDDNFFRNSLGQIADPDLIGTTWTLATATFTKIAGKFRGTYYLDEADIYLRSDFFERSKKIYEVIMTGLARFAFGYQANISVWDLNGDNQVFAYSMFVNQNKPMWKKLAQEWDRIFYDDPVSEAASISPSATTPEIIPGNGFVLDIADYELPDTDGNNPFPTVKSNALFVTNLLAFSGGKKLTAKFTAVYPDPNNANKTIKKKIFNVSNNLRDYPQDSSFGKLYPTIWMNRIAFARKGELNKMKTFIRNFGTAKNIEGKSYKKALQVQVQIIGYMSETGGKKSKTVTVFFVNSDDE